MKWKCSGCGPLYFFEAFLVSVQHRYESTRLANRRSEHGDEPWAQLLYRTKKALASERRQ
jgi:hypothetical protein